MVVVNVTTAQCVKGNAWVTWKGLMIVLEMHSTRTSCYDPAGSHENPVHLVQFSVPENSMATKKWLNIVVDGNSALSPYWPNIFSDCLQNIVRTFFNESREEFQSCKTNHLALPCILEGANNVECEVALVMYNANSDFGLDLQCIHWTREVNYFLAMLSSLVFNGNDENQRTMVQGLAEALAMFPRPSNIMTTEEYYNGRRHCILVAARDPIPTRMPISVPQINQGRTIGTQLHTLNADFYEVAEMFCTLAASLSIISPVQHPIFEVIFNMGNNGSPLSNPPISNMRIGQLNVFLSRNFKEAHDALRGKRRMDADRKESQYVPGDLKHPSFHLGLIFSEDLFSAVNMVVTGEPIIEAAKDFMLESLNPLSLAVPNASPSAVVSTTPTSTTGEDQEEIGKRVVEGSSETYLISTSFGEGMVVPRGASPTDNSMFLHSRGNIFNTQPYLATPILPYASNSSIRPRLPFLVAGFDLYGRPVFGPSTGVPLAPITPQFNPSDFWPPPPFSTYSQNFVQAWQVS
ncbi:unnamed protein product [Sphenostylis stenocarpa]|uniref:Mediator of RNA polymerase II transcription subunit 25 n=1 Tax=Sphenostylis stenocarpa TaxID=92480 RepID=A0AA86SCI9_9FABA|nr:unnamed protein product [Sphenostylis stenocarpa]